MDTKKVLVLSGVILVGGGLLFSTTASYFESRRSRIEKAQANLELNRVKAEKAALTKEIEAKKEALRIAEEEANRAEMRANLASQRRRDAESRLASVPDDAPCESHLAATRDAYAASTIERDALLKAMAAGKQALAECKGTLASCETARENLSSLLKERDLELFAEEKKPKAKWWKNRLACGPGVGVTVGPGGEMQAGLTGGCVVRLWP